MHSLLLAAPVLAKASTKSGSSSIFLLFLLIIVAAAFLFMRPNSKRRRAQAQQLRTQVVPGAEVRTNAGLYATVVTASESEVLLEIAPGVRCRFDPRVVVAVTKSVDDPAPVTVDASLADAASSATVDAAPADAAPVDAPVIDAAPADSAIPGPATDGSATGTGIGDSGGTTTDPVVGDGPPLADGSGRLDGAAGSEMPAEEPAAGDAAAEGRR